MTTPLSLEKIALSVILGIGTILILPKLPSEFEWIILSLTALFLFLIRLNVTRYSAIFIIGGLWATFVASQQIDLINRYSQHRLNAVGTVQSLLLDGASTGRVIFNVEQVEQSSLPLYQQFTIGLWFPESYRPAAGQRWRVSTHLRPTHAVLNQGGVDRQRWAFANRLFLNGRVMNGTLLDDQVNVRQSLFNMTYPNIRQLEHGDIVLALAFGERGLMDKEKRRLMLKTGIAHLMAISGLHISLAAMLGFMLARAGQWLLPQRAIGLWFPSICGWLLALVYVLLSGANPPALRAFLALTFWLVFKRYYLFCSPWQMWLYIVASLLIFDPLMVLSDSFWLSCSAVGALIFWFQWFPLKNQYYQKRWLILRWLHLQCGISCLLLPLQITFFQGVSISSIACNLIAVPIVSFLTVPAILLAVLLTPYPSMSQYCWVFADKTLAAVFAFLNRMPSAWVDIANSYVLIACMVWVLAVVFRLKMWLKNAMACVAVIIILSYPLRHKPDYLWRLDMLDVGHGLAIVIHNGDRAIIYDTGGRNEDTSLAERVIIPFLNWHGLTLEGIILSHDHLDHSGGVPALMQRYPQAWLKASTKRAKGQPCIDGENWLWQGLNFHVLWPKRLVDKAENKDSCVVSINDGRFRVLLTGDLEKEQELELVASQPQRLKADILQTPHHGSNTSSSGPFLRKVLPALTLTSISRFNPWRLPSEKVKKRYRSMGIDWLATSRSGQISILFYKDKYNIYRFREDLSYRWYNQWFGDMPLSD